ncbi:MAG TPA: hypothetical protein VK879_19690 [Candidatus Sulfomarinibacteraceae bacterium]|nr:hypothetical protein [Candidatus Sulfomarinibacteraceae bacterium]
MLRNILALLGLLLFVSGLILLTVELSQQQATLPEETSGILSGILHTDTQAVIIAGIGLLLGPLLTIPWWRYRLREEEKWLEKRDEPIEGPPRIPT